MPRPLASQQVSRWKSWEREEGALSLPLSLALPPATGQRRSKADCLTSCHCRKNKQGQENGNYTGGSPARKPEEHNPCQSSSHHREYPSKTAARLKRRLCLK